MPSASQKSYFAVRAFNVELASIKDGSHVRRRSPSETEGIGAWEDDSLGGSKSSIALHMRMQWWRDSLETIYRNEEDFGGTGNADPLLRSLSVSCWHSPVVRSLYQAVQEHELTQRFLERLIDARETDLDLTQPQTVQEMIDYAEETSSSLLYMSLECTGVRDDQADAVASHAGIGVGLTLCLRATPFRLVHGEVPLASELFPKRFDYRATLRELEDRRDASPSSSASDATKSASASPFDSDSALVWQEAARHVAHEAALHLRQAHELQRAVPKQSRACLLSMVPAMHYLAQLQQYANYHVWDPRLLQPDPRSRLSLLMLMGRAWLTGVI
jgi:NADH dehydrogenase [ubiquinone] 1 alpha subcomplex assembly factor 6